MTEIRAVDNPTEDPKTGKERPTSDVRFPYYDLKTAIEVAKTVHDKGGGRCSRDQLAAFLGHKAVRSGAFLSKVSAVKMFGLINEKNDAVELTDRGRAIVAPVTPEGAAKAKVDAFLDVELFRKVYVQFSGNSLPPEVGLKNLLANKYGVVESRIPATVRILLDSAQQAGFFDVAGNRSRMIKPLGVTSGNHATVGSAPAASTEEPTKDDLHQPHPGGGGGGGNGPGGDIDPAILGLLQRLPPGGTPLSAKRRKALIDAFTATVAFIYPEAEEE